MVGNLWTYQQKMFAVKQPLSKQQEVWTQSSTQWAVCSHTSIELVESWSVKRIRLVREVWLLLRAESNSVTINHERTFNFFPWICSTTQVCGSSLCKSTILNDQKSNLTLVKLVNILLCFKIQECIIIVKQAKNYVWSTTFSSTFH